MINHRTATDWPLCIDFDTHMLVVDMKCKQFDPFVCVIFLVVRTLGFDRGILLVTGSVARNLPGFINHQTIHHSVLSGIFCYVVADKGTK